jgi:hypothetical protein
MANTITKLRRRHRLSVTDVDIYLQAPDVTAAG